MNLSWTVACSPLVDGDVADLGERAPAIEERAHDAGAAADLPVGTFDHAVRAARHLVGIVAKGDRMMSGMW